MDAPKDPREWFERSSDAVVALVGEVPDEVWDRPGLGTWTVRELVAHMLRAWSTVRDYLAEPVPSEGTPVLTAVGYLAQGLVIPGIHEGVAQRAREDAIALAGDPASVARRLAEEVAGLVAGTRDDRLLPTRVGVMTFAEYLRTRAFELTVHGLDVVRATGLPRPAALAACAVPALGLMTEVAGERGTVVPLLEAATGRVPLPEGYSLLE